MQQIYTREVPIRSLEGAIESYNALLLKTDNFKVDLQSGEGIEAFKTYVDSIRTLIENLNIKVQSRDFRGTYTKAYRVLYSQADLGYIPQIFDAAQEAFPYIWVNGECYEFQAYTIEKGEKLIEIHFKLIQLIRLIYLHSGDKNKVIPLAYNMQLRQRLQEFDSAWVQYEKAYIEELIAIEEQSKKNIIQTLEIQRELTEYENSQRIKGKIFYHNEPEYHILRQKLCEKLAKLNSVANISGKGRDDLTYSILTAAENVLTKISDSQSKSIRMVAEKIRESFGKCRQVLKNFEESIQMVDPQLKNNQSLVEALAQYQLSWQKGKKYFLEQRKQCQILTFSTILQAAREKYPNFKQQLQYSDPCVFWMIPSVIVLCSLQGEDQGLAESFIQEMKSNQKLAENYVNLREDYQLWKANHNMHTKRELYNELQSSLISELGSQQYKEITSKIKQFAINLQRLNPTDWNDMLSMLLIQQN